MTQMPEGRDIWVQQAMSAYESRLTLYAARLTGDDERARDVVQETFLKLCQHAPAELNGKLAEWLYTVCRHLSLDVRRKEKRMTALSEAAIETRAEKAPRIEAAEETSGMLRALGSLSTPQQEVLRLKFQHGLSYKEISRITGHSVSNVGVLIHTGLKLLREQMKD